MLCSKCSRPVLPVVALDIDGVLGNYHWHFFKFMEGYIGRKPQPNFSDLTYQGDQEYGEFICDAFETTKAEFRSAKLAYRQGGLKRTMPAFMDAASLAKTVYDKCELWITTTRPYLRVDAIDPDTREWLRRNGIPYHGLLFHNDKYQVLADRVDPRRVVAVLDDLKENLESASELFGEHIPIQFGTSYNRAARFTPYVSTHIESIMAIRKRIDIWTEEMHSHGKHSS